MEGRMKNAAMFVSKDDFNPFTDAVRTKIEADGKCLVKLRDDQWREIVFLRDESDEDSELTFRTVDWSFWWYNDGSSCKNTDLDMVEIRDV
jgi:hypothetical protein